MESYKFGRTLAATLLGAAVLAGCNESKNSQASAPESQPDTTLPSHPTAQQEKDAYDMAMQAFDSYVGNFNANHVGNIALGMCVGWEASKPGDITVVLNPGLANVTKGNLNVGEFIFSYMDTSKMASGTPESTLLNGPYAGTIHIGNQALEFGPMIDAQPQIITFVEAPRTTDPNISRHISTSPVRQPNGSWSFEDLESNIPLIDTMVTSGPLTQARVLNVCNQLQPGYAGPGAQA